MTPGCGTYGSTTGGGGAACRHESDTCIKDASKTQIYLWGRRRVLEPLIAGVVDLIAPVDGICFLTVDSSHGGNALGVAVDGPDESA